MCCNKNYQRKFHEKLKQRFFNTYKFSDHENNKFILLLRKGVYPYKYMDEWEKFNETSLPENEDFYSHLNVKGINDTDYYVKGINDTDYYAHTKRVCKDFEIKKLRKYHDLYVQSNTLLLADYLLSAPGLAWQAALKKTELKEIF